MHRSLTTLGIATTLLLARAALAMPDGISGYSGLTADKTCVACHPGGNPPTASIDGPAMLAAGASAEYTFTLKTDRTFGGLDVAVDNAAARLMPVSPMTQLLGGEITHTKPLPVTNGEIVVKLGLTAPPTAGTVTLHADGQADKMPQIADSSAAAIDFVVTITGAAVGSGNGNGSGTGGVGASSPSAAPMHGCSFAIADAVDASFAPAWLALLAVLALIHRGLRD
jgi:hypothetical protein